MCPDPNFKPFLLINIFFLQQSSFEAPTEPDYKIHSEGSNKGKVKLTNGLGNQIK
jgi:hypothetical protein